MNKVKNIDKNAISDNVMRKIKHGDIRMKPRAYFMILSSLVLFASAVTGLALSYIFSVLFFWIRIETSSNMAYGARRNLADVVSAFPWWIILVGATLVAIIIILIRKYRNLYRYRLSFVIVLIIFLSLATGYLINMTGVINYGNKSHGSTNLEHKGRGQQQTLK